MAVSERSREGGHVEIVLNGKSTVFPTFTCEHCQRIFKKPGPNEDYYFCGPCYKPICKRCAELRVCIPWKKQMERIEARARSRASIEAAIARMT